MEKSSTLMVKFYAYCCQKDLSDNNGGSLVLWHHGHALEALGQVFGGMLNLTDAVPEDADYIMFQSEWWGLIRKHLQNSMAKRICWLGHIKPHQKYGMPLIESIDADFYHTQYTGEAVEYAQSIIKKSIHYLPHAGCHTCNVEGKIIDSPPVVFIGNHFPERSEEWLTGVSLIQAPFEQTKDYYRSAIVCPNIHGSFQKGEASDFFQLPAHMINERIFQVLLSGGFAISDNTPIVKEFFKTDEIPYAETKEEFQALIRHFLNNPAERIPYMVKAKQKILDNHLYTHRWKGLLSGLEQTGRITS